MFGTVVSASFLLLIGLLNLIILVGIARVFRSMRRGEYDEAELERQLENRGFFYRFFGRWMKAITKEWQLYPVGVVFGLGFDTATEVALLATTALLASQHIPWYAILCLPILFTAGMTLMDTTDGLFMNLAYGWAFLNPVRKVYYNLAITGLSVAICFFIGGVEVLGLFPQVITRAQPEPRLLELHRQLQHQHRRVRDRGHVHSDLAGRAARLALRPDRGKVDRQAAARNARRHRPRARRHLGRRTAGQVWLGRWGHATIAVDCECRHSYAVGQQGRRCKRGVVMSATGVPPPASETVDTVTRKDGCRER